MVNHGSFAERTVGLKLGKQAMQLREGQRVQPEREQAVGMSRSSSLVLGTLYCHSINWNPKSSKHPDWNSAAQVAFSYLQHMGVFRGVAPVKCWQLSIRKLGAKVQISTLQRVASPSAASCAVLSGGLMWIVLQFCNGGDTITRQPR